MPVQQELSPAPCGGQRHRISRGTGQAEQSQKGSGGPPVQIDIVDRVRLHERLGFSSVGTAREVGTKFGRWLDLTFLQLTLDADADAPPSAPTPR